MPFMPPLISMNFNSFSTWFTTSPNLFKPTTHQLPKFNLYCQPTHSRNLPTHTRLPILAFLLDPPTFFFSEINGSNKNFDSMALNSLSSGAARRMRLRDIFVRQTKMAAMATSRKWRHTVVMVTWLDSVTCWRRSAVVVESVVCFVVILLSVNPRLLITLISLTITHY